MKKDIIINATSSEIRVALTEDNRLAELFLELPDKERHVGSIFLGRVERVVQGMNAAFVDIGLEQHAFLHFSDAANAGEDFTDLLTDDDEEEEQQKEKEARGGKEQKKGRSDSKDNKKNEQKKQDRRPNKPKGSNKQSGNQSGQKEEKPSGDQPQGKTQQDKPEQDKQKKQERGKGQRDNRNSGKSQSSDSRRNEQKSSPAQGNQGQGATNSGQEKKDAPPQHASDKKQESQGKQQGENAKQGGTGEKPDQPQRKRPRLAPRGRHPRPRPKPAEKPSEEIESAKEAKPNTTPTEQADTVQDKKQGEETTAQPTEAQPKRKPNRRRGGRSNAAKKAEGQSTSTDEQKKSDDSPAKTEQKSGEKETSGEVGTKSESTPNEKPNEAKPTEGSQRSSSRSRNSRRREKARKSGQTGQTETKTEKSENKDDQKPDGQSPTKATANEKPASEGSTDSKPAASDGTATSESSDAANKPKRRRPSRRKKKPQGESATNAERTGTQDSADKDSSANKGKPEPTKETSSPSSEKEAKESSSSKSAESESGSGSSTAQTSSSAPKRRKRPARKKPAASSGSTDAGAEKSKEDNKEKPTSSRPKTMDAKLPTFQTKRHGEVTIALEKGQDILVQVTRESYASKGVKVSTKISLPGRFIVLLPLDPMVGISRKVLDIKERRRLRAVARKMLPDGFGCIIRTVAQDKETEVLEQELQMLLDRWKSIEEKLKTANTPGVLYQDQSVANTVMRDLFTPDVSRVIIDNKKLYTEIRDYVSWAAPTLLNKVEHYTGRSPIFQHCGVEKDMDNMLGPKVWLSTGGYLIMEQTEAMMVIDVNSGRYAKDKEQEINALRTNLESARELARQIRLRDIGGLIIVDFIDLYDEKNRKKVYDELKKEMSRDRAKSVVLPMTQFGLVQMTRQRVRQQLVQTMSEPCPTCNGKGLVQSSSTIVRRMERWLAEFRSETREFRLTLTAHPQLIEYLTEGDSMSRLTKLMLKHFVRIKLVPDEGLGIEQFRFFSVKRQEDITDEYMPK